MVALTLTSVIVVLVSTVFLVQNRFFSQQVQRAAAHDNARMVTELIAAEIRSVMVGGMVVASNKDMVLHSPMVLAAVCAWPSTNKVTVQLEGGTADFDTNEFGGFAVRDSITGSWSYYDVGNWNSIKQNGGKPAEDCAANGADTVGATSEFTRLKNLDSYYGVNPPVGTILMLYRNVEFKFAASEMDSTAVGLYRGIYGNTLVEFATGMDSTAAFQYRTGGSTYSKSATGANLAKIDAVRITAEARKKPETGGAKDITYGWSVNLVLRNGN